MTSLNNQFSRKLESSWCPTWHIDTTIPIKISPTKHIYHTHNRSHFEFYRPPTPTMKNHLFCGPNHNPEEIIDQTINGKTSHWVLTTHKGLLKNYEESITISFIKAFIFLLPHTTSMFVHEPSTSTIPIFQRSHTIWHIIDGDLRGSRPTFDFLKTTPIPLRMAQDWNDWGDCPIEANWFIKIWFPKVKDKTTCVVLMSSWVKTQTNVAYPNISFSQHRSSNLRLGCPQG